MEDYLIIDTKKNTKGEIISEIQSFESSGINKITIKQYSGINTDNFILSKKDGKILSFGFFTLNGIHYISLNGEHIIDYYKFIDIKKVTYDTSENYLKIVNRTLGDIYINNCDVDIFKKALSEMNIWMKNKKSIIYNLLYYMMN